MRKYSKEQQEVFKACAERTAYKLERHWKMWSRPMKAKACILNLSRTLSSAGLSQNEFRSYLTQESIAQIATTPKHNVELVFPAGLEESEVYQGLIDHENDAIEEQELRKRIRRKLIETGVG